MNHPWLKITISLALIATVAVGTWAIIDKLDDATFKVIVGVGLALIAFLVVGALFIGYSLLQAYLVRRAIQQDDLNDMRQMAFITRLMQPGAGRVNVTMPWQQQPDQALLPPGQSWSNAFDGAYRDTTADRIEVE